MMHTRRVQWLPLKKVMWLLVVIATVFMVITLHLGDSLAWFKTLARENIRTVHGISIDTEEIQRSTIQGYTNMTLKRSLGLQLKNFSSQIRDNHAPDDKVNTKTLNGNSSGYKWGGNLSLFRTGKQSQRDNSADKRSPSTGVHGPGRNLKLVQTIFQDYLSKYARNITSKVMELHFNNKHGDVDSQLHASSMEHHDRHVQDTNYGPKKAIQQVSINNVPVITDIISNKSYNGGHTGWYLDDTHLTTIQALYDWIIQVEKPSLLAPSVVVKGPRSSVQHHLPLIEAAFHKYKVKVTYEAANVDIMTNVTDPDSRCIVMCLNTTTDKEDNCVISSQTTGLRTMNFIPEMMSVLMSPKLLCDMTEKKLEAKSNGKWCGGNLPCYTQVSADTTTYNSCDVQSGWWVVYKNSSGLTRQYLPCGTSSSLTSFLTSRSTETLLVPLPHGLLTLEDTEPLVWQVEVLVTSLHPPRVYLHPAGIAWSSLHEFVYRKHPKNVSLLELGQLITEVSNETTASLTLMQLQTVIMDAVRLIEKHITVARPNIRLCDKCFQLLTGVLMFDSSFHPVILDIFPSHYSEHLNSLSDYLLEQNILDDLAAMLVSRENISIEILKAMIALGMRRHKDGKICSENDGVCLGEIELNYLLDTRREQRASRNWIRLFPSTVVTCANIHSSSARTLEAVYGFSQKPVGHLEKFAMLIEEFLLCPLPNLDNMKAGLTVPVHIPLDATNDSWVGRLSKMSVSLNGTCDNDNNSLPYLSAIHTYPYIQLYPEFTSLNTEYEAYTDYLTTLVQIRGVPKHCATQAKLEDKITGDSRWGNFSVGLGQNTAHILVVGMDNLEPYILNIYKVYIHRRRAGHDTIKFDLHKGNYHACSLKQDCSLSLSSDVLCGLQPVVSNLTWRDYMKHQLGLSHCETESMAGKWMVPCSDCTCQSSCYWSQAIWQQPGCKEDRLKTDELKKCLTGKKVLFIGDSTNRGILHHILERLNGSLLHWDKTHNIRIYPNLNDGQTVFGFAYYPQFWLMPRERPMFDKTIHQLLNRTAEFSGKEIVIVLGGVHWLGKHHLDMLVNTLWREGLENSKVVVKSLGAGFHQPVSGVHQLSVNEQQRLASQNQAVMSYAHKLGFSTVDTFSMTMSRYRDFLQGNCACHFHQVSAVQPSISAKLSWKSPASTGGSIRYHVEGDINAAYSEMVLNRICAKTRG